MRSNALERSAPSVVVKDYDVTSLPTQAWFFERLRCAMSQAYSLRLKDEQDEIDTPDGVHQGWVAGFVSRALGSVVNQDVPQFSVIEGLRLLTMLGDVAPIGNGYYLPRESRVTVFTSGWGRISGGLPLSESEHNSANVVDDDASGDTLGRAVRLKRDEKMPGSEDLRRVIGVDTPTEALVKDLIGVLPSSACRITDDGDVSFYDATLRRARTRGERWQAVNKCVGDVIVARTRGLPSHYFVWVGKNVGGQGEWLPVGKDIARIWIVVAERLAGSRNRIRGKRVGSEGIFLLPDMLPDVWTMAIMACSSCCVRLEKCYDLRIPARTEPAVDALLASASIEVMYE